MNDVQALRLAAPWSPAKSQCQILGWCGYLKTILVECLTPRSRPKMNEVNDIATAIGYDVVGQVTQRRESVDSSYCVGEGKLQEISENR